MSRLIAKDVRPEAFVAFEPNESLRQIYKELNVPGLIVATDWASSESLERFGTFDLVIAFSILTHASDDLARRIFERWVEITRPGSVVVLTIRPRWFLGEASGDAAVFGAARREDLFQAYDRGNPIFVAYEGSPTWGVSVTPPDHLVAIAGDHFDVEMLSPLPETPSQVAVVLTRR